MFYRFEIHKSVMNVLALEFLNRIDKEIINSGIVDFGPTETITV